VVRLAEDLVVRQNCAYPTALFDKTFAGSKVKMLLFSRIASFYLHVSSYPDVLTGRLDRTRSV